MTYPFDDEYMRYDYDEHRYILTERAVLDKLNINLYESLNSAGVVNKERAPQLFLDEISDFIYSQVYDYATQWEIKEYEMAKLPSARKNLMKAMLKQIDYVNTSGLLYQYCGIDLKKNTKIDGMSGRFLAPLAKSALTKTLENGVPLLYAGKYPYIFKADYEKYNY